MLHEQGAEGQQACVFVRQTVGEIAALMWVLFLKRYFPRNVCMESLTVLGASLVLVVTPEL